MSETLAWKTQLSIVDGPTAQLAGTLTPEVYEKMTVTVAKGGTAKEVEFQPAKASVLLVQADPLPKDSTGAVTCTIDSQAYDLGSPLLAMGSTLIAKVAGSDTKLSLANSDKKNDATVHILICRDA